MPDIHGNVQLPDYQECMLPLLRLISNGQDYRLHTLTNAVADHFRLSETARSEMLPSGQQTVIANRVAWAKTYLKKAGLLENPARGLVRISDEGKKVLESNPAKIDNEFLKAYSSFTNFLNATTNVENNENQVETTATPEESIESAHRILHSALIDELIEKVKACHPTFFEHLVVELLVAMGYGGSLTDAGQAIGGSGDGGIDGTIKEDKLGLDVICIQAKRWERNVGRPEVQAFAGSMEGRQAKKGVMITTASFSREAIDYIQRIERKIVLIDGRKLAELMIEHDIGVSTAQTYLVKRLDFDYFDEEQEGL